MIDEVLHRGMALGIRDHVEVVEHEDEPSGHVDQTVDHLVDHRCQIGIWTAQEPPGRVGQPRDYRAKGEEDVSPQRDRIVLGVLEGHPGEPPIWIDLSPLEEQRRLAIPSWSVDECHGTVVSLAHTIDEMSAPDEVDSVARHPSLGQHEWRDASVGGSMGPAFVPMLLRCLPPNRMDFTRVSPPQPRGRG